MKTVYCSALELALLTNGTHEILNGTTLNEQLGIDGRFPPSTPFIQYFSIGIWDRQEFLTSDGVFKINKYTHRPTDILLEKIVPFRILPLGEELTQTESRNYRLSRVEDFGGVPYICYYLKKTTTSRLHYLEVTNVPDSPTLKIEQITSNIATQSDNKKREIDLTSEDIKYIGVNKNIISVLTPIEFESIKQYVDLKYPNVLEPFLAEVCLCSGTDKQNSQGMYEATGVQPAYFLDVDSDLDTGLGKTFIFELGDNIRTSTEGI